MISVLTLTYKRHHLLEEAIQSFLFQNNDICEMVVINDNAEVDYVFNHPNVRIINHKERFPSIAAKFEWGCKMCKHQYIYRLDDDDLLAPEALENVIKDINNNPDYEIYRCGMGTLHISGMGQVSNKTVLDQADRVLDNTTGVIELIPKFLNDYYSQLNKKASK